MIVKTKSPLPWFGSDAGVAPQLAAMLDGCNHVTIPFAGGMSILPHLKAKGIVANDLHSHAFHFYRTMSGSLLETAELICRCQQKSLSHPSCLQVAYEVVDDIRSSNVDRAWAFWAICWIGRKGKGGTTGSNSVSVRHTAEGGNNASRLVAAAGDLEAWAEEFKRCEFTCVDFNECISKVRDGEKQGIYLDPPWIGAGDAYTHNFAAEDHENLAAMLQKFMRSPIVLRYGDCPEIRELYGDFIGFEIQEATSRTQANKPLGEIWITRNL